MKIEKLNDNQIRCTLTRADLSDRQLKLSELAYGTEKAKSLFQDMMQQAAFECGFEAENSPLMIEAIPASADSIVLIITKVDDPEELDARFSRFAPTPGNDWDIKKEASLKLEGAEDILSLLGKVKESISSISGPSPDFGPNVDNNRSPEERQGQSPALRLFSFGTIDDVINAAHLLAPMYDGANTLYKDNGVEMFILAITQSDYSTGTFSRICNMLSEYGTQENSSGATLAFLEEHCEIILAADAIQKLAQI